jgi:hypothetical protein
MTKRPKSDGRCIHCRRTLVKKTKDHVFPRSWYPESTSAEVHRWTVPSCALCNGELGEIEKEVFVRLALCVNPRKPAAAGISRKAIRSLGIGATGLSEEERQHRKALKDKVFRDAKPYTSDIQPHVLPGMGPHPEVPAVRQIQITIPGERLISVAKKITRGCEYWLADGRIVEPPCEIEVFFIPGPDLPDNVRQLYASLNPVHLGTGLRIRRAGAQDDPRVAMYEIVIWDSLTFYSAIIPPEVETKGGTPFRAK